MTIQQVEYAAGDDDEDEDEENYGDDDEYDDEDEDDQEEDDDDDAELDDEEQWDRGWSGNAGNSHQSSNMGSHGQNTSVSSDAASASDKVCHCKAASRHSAADCMCCRSACSSCSKGSRFSRPTQASARTCGAELLALPTLRCFAICETKVEPFAARAKAVHSQVEAAHMKSSSALASAAAMAQRAQTNLQNIHLQQQQQYSDSLASSSSTTTSQVRQFTVRCVVRLCQLTRTLQSTQSTSTSRSSSRPESSMSSLQVNMEVIFQAALLHCFFDFYYEN
jgi:hypothetical protein